MDETQSAEEQQSDEVGSATPIFNVYRRGYDPEQVDRYVSDQQRRLDEAVYRASEAERKLAAAVGQLRELHRRVAVYESEARNTQPPALDTLGERVQRILQEAWEGAYNLRQEAEKEVADLRQQAESELDAKRRQAEADVEELRQVASREAAELVDEATRRALALRDEMDRRRQAYLERVERDRQSAVTQISYLYDQRELALGELARLQATVQATVEEMVHSPLAKAAAEIAGRATPEATTTEPVDEEQGLFEQASEVDLGSETPEHASAFPQGDDLDKTIVTALDETALVIPSEEASASLFDEMVTSGAASEVPGPEEIPTGPMDAVELAYEGYLGAPAGEVSPAAVSSEPEAPASHDGVYDAEEEGWA
jgi:hypothetical protein